MLSYLKGFWYTFEAYFRLLFSDKNSKDLFNNLVNEFDTFLTKFYQKSEEEIIFFSKLYYTKDDGLFVVYFVKYPNTKEDLKVFFYFSEEISIEYNGKQIIISGKLTKQKYKESLVELKLVLSEKETKFIFDTRLEYTPMIKLFLGQNSEIEEDKFYDVDGINELVYTIALTDFYYDVYLFSFHYETKITTLKMPGVSNKEFEIKDFTRDEIRGFVEEMKGVGYSEKAT